MPLLVFFLIWYFVVGRQNPRIYNKIERWIKPIVIGLILVTFAPGLFGGAAAIFGLSIALLALLSPLLVPIVIFSAVFGGKKKKARKVQVNDEPQMSTGLSKSIPKRRKIVKKFNKVYGLNLTEDEINKMVDASYMSFAWEKEIKDMDGDYDNVYEWYNSMTNWLRAYLKAFPVHTVSSDFARQKEIVVETFDQLLREINPESYTSLEECIYDINNKYYCVLDETTFMMMYRLLQASGRYHKLPTSNLIRHESDIDRLKKKYDETANADVYSKMTASENAANDLIRMRGMQ